MKPLLLPDADIFYESNFLETSKCDSLFKTLRTQIAWQQDDIKLFGKTYAQPRLTALFAENKKTYSYSGIKMEPKLFPEELLILRDQLKRATGIHFTTCLLNLYRDGQDSNGWHADNEKELGENPQIASISLGAPRFFKLKHNSLKEEKHKLLLENGSLLLMKGTTQHYWKHEIPKTKKHVGERINLTFRIIK
ncbi:alpha-ketoglutarate-dependent dioxygenase AlkB [Mesonia sp. MT50]|uniref:Alpha-ketoglutarate-dependent dioxygenase AlkB n=1 Tax=Mesonia profundi TaxID=3070998 RepID=A0ABU1A4M9_9FLAO|nr:alpha-ketoglutarate-dependent dioxygenase AlkB [Mesonia profundi]MDQ7918554.1 alpha-ketoglutarate-dependent dioxygenase AlkB [Mesonia profundi]